MIRALKAAARAALEALPHREIVRDEGGDLYLTRYLVASLPGDVYVYVHCFHASDADDEQHDHPWAWAGSLILAGGYLEERLGAFGYTWRRRWRPGMVNLLKGDTFHRVELVDGRPAWTLFVTGPRVKSWGFRDLKTGAVTPWKVRLAQRGVMPS